jgi:stress-induced morphogen
MATEEAVSEVGLKAKLQSALQAQYVEVHDVSGGCGQSFEVVVVSNMFEGKPLLQRHR